MIDRDFETLGHNRVGEDEGPVIDLVRRPREIAEAAVIVLPSGRLALSTIGFYTVDLGPDVQRLPCLVTLQGILEKAMREAHKSGVAKERARQTMEVNRFAAIARARENQANAELRAKLIKFPDLNEPGLAHAVLSGTAAQEQKRAPEAPCCGHLSPQGQACTVKAGHRGWHGSKDDAWPHDDDHHGRLARLSESLAEARAAVTTAHTAGADEERARVERLLQDEVDGAHADVNAAEEMAGQARSRRGALRSVLARVVGVAGPTPVEG